MVLVGLPPTPHPPVQANKLTSRRRALSGSGIGGIKETQEMLDFCAEHGVACEIELIRIQQINEAYERVLRSDVKYRFVIDMASLRVMRREPRGRFSRHCSSRLLPARGQAIAKSQLAELSQSIAGNADRHRLSTPCRARARSLRRARPRGIASGRRAPTPRPA